MVIEFVEKLEKSEKPRCHQDFSVLISVVDGGGIAAEKEMRYVEKSKAWRACGNS